MLDIACGKSGHSSTLLNVNLTSQVLECIIVVVVVVLLNNNNKNNNNNNNNNNF